MASTILFINDYIAKTTLYFPNKKDPSVNKYTNLNYTHLQNTF